MQLIASLTSPYARKIRVLLLEKGLPFAMIADNPHEPDSAVSKVNPLGKVPALLADDGRCWFDSPVIAEYLETLSASPYFLPSDRLGAVEVKQIEALADGVLDAGVLVLLEGRRPAAQQSEAWCARHWGKVEAGLAALEARVAGREWFVGGNITLADIAVGCMWGWLDFRFPKAGVKQKYPALATWGDKILARPSFVQTHPPA
ncbi:glutathione S-transferase [Niveibacterium sp. 24ML]|uniref:glutathione S-transferase n=1 Tax=Niveibacterium sp. 24ML TaxID=2985512 RepID=UPI00226F44F4|nr:glutathione S-transferase [Niveibacterium sp. 24ML]MCX9155671.1 glutathione S-transferase [Niveibacterium sp. 24ML]